MLSTTSLRLELLLPVELSDNYSLRLELYGDYNLRLELSDD